MPDVRIRIRKVVERDIVVRDPRSIEDALDAVQMAINNSDLDFHARLRQLEVKDAYFETSESEQLPDDGYDPDFLVIGGGQLVIYDYAYEEESHAESSA